MTRYRWDSQTATLVAEERRKDDTCRVTVQPLKSLTDTDLELYRAYEEYRRVGWWLASTPYVTVGGKPL